MSGPAAQAAGPLRVHRLVSTSVDYAGPDVALYVKSIKDSSPMFTADGVMPAGGPQTVLDVLGTFSEIVKSKKDSIDLNKTYTTEFASKAK